MLQYEINSIISIIAILLQHISLNFFQNHPRIKNIMITHEKTKCSLHIREKIRLYYYNTTT